MVARFWVLYRGGWVRLTLRPGQSVKLVEGGPTEEGWNWLLERYTHEGDGVALEWAHEARDCDGQYDRYGKMFCLLGGLAALDMHAALKIEQNRGIFSPDWRKVYAGHRDHAAEAAGY